MNAGRIGIIGGSVFVLLLLFQNFTNKNDMNVKNILFQKAPEQSSLRQAARMLREDPKLHAMASQASGYADFVGVEDVRKMSDAEILSRVSDSMFTSLEVIKMENPKATTGELESVARALEKDAQLQRIVISMIREKGRVQR